MNEEIRQLIEAATRVELNVAKLYRFFHYKFPEDADFWWKLSMEEENHAALLRSGEEYFLDSGDFPSELLVTSLELVTNLNTGLERILSQESEISPSREFAFNFALKIEGLAGEVHFQQAMQKTENPSEALKLFQSLNKTDKNHAGRIRSYMREKGIAITRD